MKNLDPKLKQVQASELNSGNKSTSGNPLYFDIDVPISIRKGTREDIKCSLYPTLNFVSF